MAPENQNIIPKNQENKVLLKNFVSGNIEEYEAGSLNELDERKSNEEANKIYKCLLEKKKVLTQLQLLKDTVSLMREKTEMLKQDKKGVEVINNEEDEIRKIYQTIENSEDANFEMALYCFENGKPLEGIEYMSKSLSISSKHRPFITNYIEEYILPDIKKGEDFKKDKVQVLFFKNFKNDVLQALNKELDISEGDEKENLEKLYEFIKEL